MLASNKQVVTIPPEKRKKTEDSLNKRLERLRRVKKVSALDRLSPEDRDYVLSYKGPVVSGSKNKHRLFPPEKDA